MTSTSLALRNIVWGQRLQPPRILVGQSCRQAVTRPTRRIDFANRDETQPVDNIPAAGAGCNHTTQSSVRTWPALCPELALEGKLSISRSSAGLELRSNAGGALDEDEDGRNRTRAYMQRYS